MTNQTIEKTKQSVHGISPPAAADRLAYTVVEVAVLLGLSRGSTYALVRSGAIPALRMGGRWIVPKQRLHAWLDEQTITAAPRHGSSTERAAYIGSGNPHPHRLDRPR